ncbi:unnamed protein product, partial [Meganyctiphanes norvegica]
FISNQRRAKEFLLSAMKHFKKCPCVQCTTIFATFRTSLYENIGTTSNGGDLVKPRELTSTWYFYLNDIYMHLCTEKDSFVFFWCKFRSDMFQTVLGEILRSCEVHVGNMVVDVSDLVDPYCGTSHILTWSETLTYTLLKKDFFLNPGMVIDDIPGSIAECVTTSPTSKPVILPSNSCLVLPWYTTNHGQ